MFPATVTTLMVRQVNSEKRLGALKRLSHVTIQRKTFQQIKITMKGSDLETLWACLGSPEKTKAGAGALSEAGGGGAVN